MSEKDDYTSGRESLDELIEGLKEDADNTDVFAENETTSELEKVAFQGKASGIRHAVRELNALLDTDNED